MAAGPNLATHAAGRMRGWLSDLGLREIFWTAAAAILAVTALFGGLDTVNTKVTPLNVGEPFSDGEFTITFQRATVVDKPPVVVSTTPGHDYLGVVVTLRNDGSTEGHLQREIDLRGAPGNQFLGAFRMADSSLLVALGPGLTDTLAFLWELPRGVVKPGGTVTLRVWRKQFRELAATYGQTWLDTDEYGEIRLPVRAKP